MKKFFAGAVLICTIFLLSTILTPMSNADWTMFRYDTSHSGAGTGNPALTTTLIWKYATNGPVESSPAVAGGVVYVGSDDGNIYAFNATNGVQLWNYSTGNSVYSSPAVVSGVVYVGSESGNLYALNASDGSQLWKYTISDEGVFCLPQLATA